MTTVREPTEMELSVAKAICCPSGRCVLCAINPLAFVIGFAVSMIVRGRK